MSVANPVDFGLHSKLELANLWGESCYVLKLFQEPFLIRGLYVNCDPRSSLQHPKDNFSVPEEEQTSEMVRLCKL